MDIMGRELTCGMLAVVVRMRAMPTSLSLATAESGLEVVSSTFLLFRSPCLTCTGGHCVSDVCSGLARPAPCQGRCCREVQHVSWLCTLHHLIYRID